MSNLQFSRREFLKRFVGSILAGAILATGGYGYARFIEPKRLSLTRQSILHNKIPNSFNGKKIVQFSDTHLNEFFTIERLEEIVQSINAQKPDIIVFTGDLIDEANRYSRVEEIVPVLQKLTAPLGKYAIFGNHDHGGYGTDIYAEIMNSSGFTLLQNQAVDVVNDQQEKIVIAGIDDLILGRPDWERTLGAVNSDTFTILLAHEPDALHFAKHFQVHLQLSGHSHGGQIKIPFFGPLYTPPYAEDFHEGIYEVDQTILYVNRGLGTTRLPYRFLSVPELTVFTLQSHE